MKEPNGAVESWLWIGLGLFCLLAAGCGDEMSGPDRLNYSEVDEVSISLQHGEVQLFGSENSQGVSIHRWLSPRDGFSVLEERQTGRRLEVEGKCVQGERCRARYDASIRHTAAVTVSLEEGEVEVIRLGGPTELSVREGGIRGSNLGTEKITVILEKGEADLKFGSPPARLELRLGREARAKVTLPDVRYRCDFDRESDRIGMNDLQCHGMVDEQIIVDPPDGRVRFEVRSPTR